MEKKSVEVGRDFESKRSRKRDREAARLALDQLQRSVEFDDGLEAEKEIGLLCGWSSNYCVNNAGDRNPLLSRLGLSPKHEFDEHEDEDEKVIYGGDDQTTAYIPLFPSRQASRVAVLKSRFMDVISKSQQQLGLLDRGTCKDYINKQKPAIKSTPSFKKPSATVKEEDLKRKLVEMKGADGGSKKPRRKKSKLATIKASVNRRSCYVFH